MFGGLPHGLDAPDNSKNGAGSPRQVRPCSHSPCFAFCGQGRGQGSSSRTRACNAAAAASSATGPTWLAAGGLGSCAPTCIAAASLCGHTLDATCLALGSGRAQRPIVHSRPTAGVLKANGRHALDRTQLGEGCEPCARIRSLRGSPPPQPSVHSVLTAGVRTQVGGLFWNYFSCGIDAKAAYGFHSMREKRPWAASGRTVNQAWYGYFSCSSGWFCAAPPLRNKATLQASHLCSQGTSSEFRRFECSSCAGQPAGMQ